MNVIPKPRRLRFKLPTDLPKHYWGGAFKTHMVNALHLILPPGERYFVKIFGRVIDDISDPVLKKKAKAFIAQEANHAGEHTRFVEFLEKEGYQVNWILNWFEDIRSFYEQKVPLPMNLSAVAGVEHYTAIIGLMALDTNLLDDMHPFVRDFMAWHAAEEVEHKDVAIDVLHHFHTSYPLRTSGFVLSSFMLWTFGIFVASYLTWQDGQLLTRQTLDDLLDIFLTENRGRRLIAEAMDYLKPDFHPTQHKGDSYAVSELKKYEAN